MNSHAANSRLDTEDFDLHITCLEENFSGFRTDLGASKNDINKLIIDSENIF